MASERNAPDPNGRGVTPRWYSEADLRAAALALLFADASQPGGIEDAQEFLDGWLRSPYHDADGICHDT